MENLKPGSELNALVAERVVGWKWAEVTFVWDTHSRRYLLPPGGINEVNHTTSGHWDLKHGTLFDLPRFSEDIAAAWDVVEKLKDKGFACAILSGIANGYDVIRFSNALGTEVCVDHAKGSTSVPHGICLAALKAVGAM